jgi:hypothetical protein
VAVAQSGPKPHNQVRWICAPQNAESAPHPVCTEVLHSASMRWRESTARTLNHVGIQPQHPVVVGAQIASQQHVSNGSQHAAP